MKRRLLTSCIALAFFGALALVGCEPESKPTPPPPVPTPKAPEVPKTPEIPKPKTSSTIQDTASGVAAAAVGAVKEALKCGLAGCTKPGLPDKTLAHAGKSLNFCCEGCLSGYKKANNIQ